MGQKSVETIATVTIAEVAPGGDGVAHVEHLGEKRAIFVARAATGDRLRVRTLFEGRPARGEIVEILEAGPERRTPPCRFAARCGGCDFMHLSLAAQEGLHREHVRRVLPVAFREVPLRYHGAPRAEQYRARARFHVAASGGRARVGFFAPRSRDLVEVEPCLVLDPAVDEARAALGGLLMGASGEGEAQVALGQARKPVLDLRWSRDLAGGCYARLDAAVTSGAWAGARVFGGEVSRPAIMGDPTPVIDGPDGAPLRLGIGGFAQAHELLNRELATRVAARLPEGLRVVELYAGAGNLTVLLARKALQLTAVENDPGACEAARENLRSRGLSAKVSQADASTYAIGDTAQAVVLDPPRTGARAACTAIVKSKARRVIYVSCDPPTLGRDLEILSARFDLVSVDLFEMFPHTSHVETVALLERRRP